MNAKSPFNKQSNLAKFYSQHFNLKIEVNYSNHGISTGLQI